MTRVIIAVLLVLGFIACWVAIALELPIASWFAYALWGSIAVGMVVRAFRRPREAAKVQFDAADQVQNMHLGRKPPTMYPADPAASSQYGDAPAPNPLDLPER